MKCINCAKFPFCCKIQDSQKACEDYVKPRAEREIIYKKDETFKEKYENFRKNHCEKCKNRKSDLCEIHKDLDGNLKCEYFDMIITSEEITKVVSGVVFKTFKGKEEIEDE